MLSNSPSVHSAGDVPLSFKPFLPDFLLPLLMTGTEHWVSAVSGPKSIPPLAINKRDQETIMFVQFARRTSMQPLCAWTVRAVLRVTRPPNFLHPELEHCDVWSQLR